MNRLRRALASEGRERPPQIRVGGKPHALGHDADDRVGDFIDLERAADDGGIAAVPVLPDAVTDDHDWRGAGRVVTRREVAPEKRLHPQHRKRIGCDGDAARPLGRVLRIADVHLLEPERRQRRERPRLVPPVFELLPRRRRAVVLVPGRVVGREVDDLVCPLERQPADEHGVHEGKDRRVHADAEPQRRRGDDGEPPVLEEHPGGESEVLQEGHDRTGIRDGT